MKEYFAIDKVKGEIVTKVPLDREVRKSYEIPVIATDGGGRSGFTTVKVKVGDLNDNSPEFYLKEYKVAIYGNTTVNSTFLKVRTFFISSTNGTYFLRIDKKLFFFLIYMINRWCAVNLLYTINFSI